MHSHTFHRTQLWLSAILLLLTGIFTSSAQAQRAINDADRVRLHGNTHPLARAEFDRGAADAAMPMNNMVLLLSVRPDAQSQLQQLLADQQNPKSPNYHQWLTPAEFGLRFGPTDQDIADATGWLRKFGFTVNEVANGRMWINFSGDVQKVERAFQTSIHQYDVNGKTHHANATDPTIPRALTGLVQGVVSLNDFPKHPNSTVNQLPPDFTAGNGANFLAPADFATIYNVNPLYNATPAIDGTGQTIAIVGRTDINLADVQFFRSFFGLPANDPVFILNGPDPGNLGGNEETEADLDVEWAGAVAKNATIKFVISQSTATTDGVDLSAQFIVNNNVANVMSTSFGLCEAALGATGNNFWNTLWAQAAAQGITAFVSAGDSGAAGCDPASATTGTGLGVNGLSSTPNNISVGGTEFNEGAGTFWSPTNDPTTQASVLSYIPEIVWNESGNVAGGTALFATGGGASTVYTKPAFQAGPGVPADGARDIPDVSLSSARHDGYLIIQGHTATTTGLLAVGGTSAASPSFAGLMALVVQKTGAAQGNANPILYTMGQNQFAGGTAVYHDITSGDNSVPGVVGFTSGVGYDEATGWGSVDAASLVNFWNSNGTPDFSLTATPASQTIVTGGSTTYTATIAALNGYTGTVSLSVTGLPAGASATFTPASIATSGNSTLAISTTAGTTPAGNYLLTMSASDGVLTHTADVTLSVTDFTLDATPASQTIVVGGSATYTATLTGLNGYTGTASLSVSGLPVFATATFTPASITGSGSSSLVITTTSNTPAAIYNLTITASDGVEIHSVPVTLEVDPKGNFSLSISPASQTVNQNQNAGYGVTVSSSGGFTAVVALSVSNLPPGATATLSPSSVQGSGLVSLDIQTSFSTPAGTYTFTVTGTSGPLVRSTTGTLVVVAPDFSLSVSPASQTILVGQPTNYTVTLSSINNFAGIVDFSVSGVPTGASATFTPASLTTSGTTTLSITTLNTVAPGTYPLTITGTSGPLVHSITATLVILAPDFSLSASPTARVILAGQATSYSVALSPLNGYTGTVSFSVAGAPAGVTATFTPASLTTSGTTTLSITSSAATVPGIYPLTITGTDGVISHSVSVSLEIDPVTAADFTISAPASITVKRNSSGSETVTITGVNGFTGTVSLSISGLPSLVTASFTPTSVTGSGTSTLTFVVDHRAQQGVYPLTVTGTSGLLVHSTSVTLTVN